MERLYHYLWHTRIKGSRLSDVDGRCIEVLDPGKHNDDAGPDFFNAKIKIDGVEWVGNVEIHIKASDWWRHRHDSDPAYENVILHVVALSDRRILSPAGDPIPQVEFNFPESFFRVVADLNRESTEVKCARSIAKLSPLVIRDWIETLSVERLQEKAQKVLDLNKSTNGDWQQTCFILLARGLGFGLNGDPFEMLARSLPLNILHRHSDNPLQIEALLFGQAGMLDATLHMFDDYFQTLCREYYFLARKYGLRPLRPGIWKYARTRPNNFPHRRIAFLASTAFGGFSFFSRLLDTPRNAADFCKLFDLKAQGYWSDHFSFDTPSRDIPATLSSSSRILLTINVAIPLLYAYASESGDYEAGEHLLGLLADLPSENNSIIRDWKFLGIEARDAAESQALIQLKKEYCDKNKCFRCRFGHQLLRLSM